MKLEFVQLRLGIMDNNSYLLGDNEINKAVSIDPSYGSEALLEAAEERGWALTQIWLTHAHFDHISGANQLARAFDPPLPIGLHPDDLDWYQQEGGAGKFGLSIPQPPPVSIHFKHGMTLGLEKDGEAIVEVRHAPGHSPGHVMFYCDALGVLFCGDVIFRGSIGRTDLPGSAMSVLMESIRQEVFDLPDDIRLLPGHGPESTVAYEKAHNPFLRT